MFGTGAKIYLSEKNFGVRCTLNFTFLLFLGMVIHDNEFEIMGDKI